MSELHPLIPVLAEVISMVFVGEAAVISNCERRAR